jgi:hypothetical protein
VAHQKPADPPTVLDILKAKDFYETAGKIGGRKWTDDELKEVRKLATGSRDLAVKLRAYKVLVDLNGKDKIWIKDGSVDETVALRGFEYLEKNLDDAFVKRSCFEFPFDNYAVMKHTRTGDVVVMLETLNPNTGGLNLIWDPARKKITGQEPWGLIRDGK